MAPEAPLTSPWAALDSLARTLEGSRFRLPDENREDRERRRRMVVDDIRRHIGPRLRSPEAPLIVAVTGPGGAGASAVVNVLADDEVSPVGVVRPTTTKPLVWTPTLDRGPWWSDLVGHMGGAESVVIARGGGPAAVPATLVDVPGGTGADPDETMKTIALADLCIVVTTATRYADAEATSLVGSLRDRGLPLLFVMNRLPPDAFRRKELIEAYVATLETFGLAGGLDPMTVFAGSEGDPGVLRVPDLDRLRTELASLEDEAFRRSLILESVAGRIEAVAAHGRSLADDLDEERAAMRLYEVMVLEAYRRQVARFAADLERGEFAALADHASWGEAAVDLAGMMTRRAGVAAEDAAAAWSGEEMGDGLLTDGGGSLRRHGKDAALQAQGQLEAWFTEMGDLAATSSRWTKVSTRRRVKLIEGIWRTVLDADRPVPKFVARALEDPQTAAKGGRDLLVAAADAALEADAERFLDHLGPAPTPPASDAC